MEGFFAVGGDLLAVRSKQHEVGGLKQMKIRVEEQQKRSERARIKAYYSREPQKTPETETGRFQKHAAYR
jgi:hypothetical protein